MCLVEWTHHSAKLLGLHDIICERVVNHLLNWHIAFALQCRVALDIDSLAELLAFHEVPVSRPIEQR